MFYNSFTNKDRKEVVGMEKDLQAVFKEKFSEAATGEYFAPGRINLIGEHTDYNGGYVFPASITLGTYGLAKKRDDREIRLYSENFPEKGIITFSLDDLTYDRAHLRTPRADAEAQLFCADSPRARKRQLCALRVGAGGARSISRAGRHRRAERDNSL